MFQINYQYIYIIIILILTMNNLRSRTQQNQKVTKKITKNKSEKNENIQKSQNKTPQQQKQQQKTPQKQKKSQDSIKDKIEDENSQSFNENQLKINQSQFVTKKEGMFSSKYEKLDKLGDGGCSEVFKTKNLKNGQMRAVKIIEKSKLPILETTHILREIEIQKNLDHPNIVKVYEYFEDSENYYIITELIEGSCDLIDEILKRDTIDELEVASIIKQILEALAYAHSNKVMHRDIKPENILYNSKQNLIKIIDWGFAQDFTNTEYLKEKCGTVGYCAPEVFQKKYDFKRDIWSVGCICYTLLVFTDPFGQKSYTMADPNNKDLQIRISGTELTIQKIQIGKYNLKHEYLKECSDEVKSFIQQLLQYKKEKRPTALEALQHPWLKQLDSKQQNNGKVHKINLQQLRINRKYHKLQQACLNYIASQLLTQKEINSVLETFKSLDTNNDGMLSKEEIILGYSKDHSEEEAKQITEQIFSQHDTDKSGQIDYTEFITATVNLKTVFKENNLKQAFQLFDINGDNYITPDEIKEILGGNVGEQILDDQFFKDFIKEADINGDNKISYQEFKKFMLKLKQI